jgi:hypothetical protein
MKTKSQILSLLSLIFIANILTSCETTKAQDTKVPNKPSEVEVVEKPFLYFNEVGSTVGSRFNVPEGYTRVEPNEGSFGKYLQNLPLKPHGTVARHFDGTEKNNSSAYCAVVDLPLRGNPNHQCADAVMRLRAEYLFSEKRYNEIEFLYVSGHKSNYVSYLGGRTPTSNNLWSYMCVVFQSANTYSLNNQMKSKDKDNLEIGDVFIIGGFPGHVVIVVDKCVNKEGNVKFMLAQSYMPAQDIHVLVGDDSNGPWYDLDFGDYLFSAEYTFSKDQMKSF